MTISQGNLHVPVTWQNPQVDDPTSHATGHYLIFLNLPVHIIVKTLKQCEKLACIQNKPSVPGLNKLTSSKEQVWSMNVGTILILRTYHFRSSFIRHKSSLADSKSRFMNWHADSASSYLFFKSGKSTYFSMRTLVSYVSSDTRELILGIRHLVVL